MPLGQDVSCSTAVPLPTPEAGVGTPLLRDHLHAPSTPGISLAFGQQVGGSLPCLLLAPHENGTRLSIASISRSPSVPQINRHMATDPSLPRQREAEGHSRATVRAIPCFVLRGTQNCHFTANAKTDCGQLPAINRRPPLLNRQLTALICQTIAFHFPTSRR